MIGQQDEALNLLLDELEQQARQHRRTGSAEDYWVCQRRHPRNPFRVACNAYFFAEGRPEVTALPGRTRNLSRCGVGLLVRRVFQYGEPVEVEIVLPGRAPMYLAGVVRFCRYAGHGYHEIGVALQCVASIPLFCKDPTTAMATHPWVRPLPALTSIP
jgi:hypothetical protein